MRAEDIKGWLRGAVREEEAVRRMMRGEAEDLGAGEGEGVEGAGDQWRALVSLVQAIWERGYIPHQMRWMIVVLLPKGGGNYRGIGLLEPIWKVMEGIMDERLNSISFHDSLHGFLAARGTGTAVIEAKLAQQLAYLEAEAFYVIFIDLRKAFDAMD